jgi:hypothetical protein
MKTAKTFRLSAQALEHLAQIAQVTGTNETAIIEIALAQFSQNLKGQPRTDTPEPPPNFPDDDDFLPVIQERDKQKQRHRHKSKSTH